VLPVKTTRYAFWLVGQLFDTSPLLHFLSVSFLFSFGSAMKNVYTCHQIIVTQNIYIYIYIYIPPTSQTTAIDI
jgi:hypothetical protein